jgi:hypothetical protein
VRYCGLILFLFTTNFAWAQSATVGVPVKREAVVLPGPELEVKPIDKKKTSVIVRITAVYPHGSDFRYDFEWYGLDAGTFDLKEFLQRKNGTPLGELPAMPVTVTTIRPPGQVEPNTLTIDPGPRVGGYRLMMFGIIALWVLGLIGIVLSFFFPRKKLLVDNSPKPISLADRLAPLVDGAMKGELSTNQLAALERGLLAYWRKRLQLNALEPVEAMNRLRTHDEAGPLLNQLESWLHKPGTRETVNVQELLQPYRKLKPDEVDLTGGEGAK